MTQQPWYTFQIISTFGEKDAEGPYWQPDLNLAVPWNYPVTAILPGTITSVHQTTYGQTVITELLDTPINNLATHMFFEHMGSSNVFSGQKINEGDLLGYTNQEGAGASLGVGFYTGDVYGIGPGWNILQNDLAPGGAHLLDATNLINSVASGSAIQYENGNSNLLVSIGVWIAENIFRINSTVVDASEQINKTPYEALGGAAIIGAVAIVSFIFVSLIGLS